LLGCNFIALICNKDSTIFCSVSLLLIMPQMYRIYINETVLVISENVPNDLKDFQKVDYKSFKISSFYQQVLSGKLSGAVVVLTPEPRELFKSVKKSFKIIKAAGGLVSNEENKYLFIFRNGRWDLPKGKLEKGEKVKKAAVREVEEECGITVTKRGDRICKTWHVYELNGQKILKRTTWYYMKAVKQPKLIPQKEEGITKAQWLGNSNFKKIKKNTYPLILEVMRFAEL
jgi:8-oxo-dGTP pyrophosphatase MutT (NUDIX family)